MTITERRLAAILATDVCNFSKMMGENEDRTIENLRTCRELVENSVTSHKGNVFNTAGDSIVAEFGSVVDAVNCAVSFQETLRDRNSSVPETARMEFRVGINLGDIIIEEDNRYGDGINIAARLEGLAEPGGICISGSVYSDIKSKLNLEFGAMGDQVLKNIAQPVSAYRIDFGGDDPVPIARVVSEETEQEATVPEAKTTSASPNQIEKPSIAVLPFDNMSGDPEQEYFSDGITEDIITALSHLNWLDVIARNSSFTYKGQSPDIRKVAEELDVRYVLEGSIRKAANRVRINAQLLEGQTANHIWAEKYDRELDDIFDLQDEITEAVLGAIEPSLMKAEIERARRKHPENLDAYDLFLRALPHLYSFEIEHNSQALDLLHRSIDVDPDYAEALAYASWGYEQRLTRGWPGYGAKDIEAAVSLAKRTIATNTQDPHPLCLSAFVLVMTGEDYELGVLTAQRALDNNPNIGFVSFMVGNTLLWGGGDQQKAISCIEQALRVSPRDPVAYLFYASLSMAHLAFGDLEQAVDAAKKSVQLNSSWDSNLWFLVAALVESGELEEAKKVVQRLQKVDESATIEKIDNNLRVNNDSLKFKIIDGLRKAGLPD